MCNLLALLILVAFFTTLVWSYASSLNLAQLELTPAPRPISLADLIRTLEQTSDPCAVRACRTP
jgi:hypothetical protein